MLTANRLHDPARARAYFQDKLAFTTGPVELDRLLQSLENNTVVVDVREAADYAKGHIPGAVNLPKGTWENPAGLSRDKTNIVYCYTPMCRLAAAACFVFASKGFPVMEMEGGFAAWEANEFEVEGDANHRFRRGGEKVLHRRSALAALKR